MSDEDRELLKEIIRQQKKIMSTLDDLNTAIGNLKSKVDNITPPVATPTDFQPQVDAVNAIGTELDTKFPPAPSATPTPTPTPTPPPTTGP